MQKLGFSIRIKSSHHIFFKEGIIEIINLQPDGSKAKAYQIKQIRDIMVKYQLGAECEFEGQNAILVDYLDYH